MQSQENSDGQSSRFWGICCEGGKKYSQVVSQKYHITMAALDPTVVPTSPVVSLMVDRGGCEYLLCSLKPGSVLQVNLNLYFDKGEKVTFFLRGQGKIHLSGYHVYDKNDQVPSEAKEKDLSTSKQLKTNLENKTTSFKKSEETKKGSMKDLSPSKHKKVQTDRILALEQKQLKATSFKESEETKKGSKKAELTKKNASSNSKQNLDESEDDDDDDPFEELDSSECEESEEDDDDDDSKKDSDKLKNYKRLWSSLTQSEEEEESDSSDSEEEVSPKKGKEVQSSKKLKKDASVLNKKDEKNTPGKSIKVVTLDNEESKSAKKTPKMKNDLLNSSIGRTPMPQKKTPKMDVSNNLSPKKVSFEIDEDSSDSVEEMDASASPSKQGQLTPPSSETKKKKKKKKKNSLNSSNVSDEGSNKVVKTGLASATYSQKLPGGLEYEDIRPGNGPLAKKGRLVHVYYTGMLENNKVFDSREPGNKPFSFKLGAEQVIKGWDVAIEGMKVGGKRRMKIPPSLGYKNQRMGPIPPNSTLYFTVELKAVS